MQQFFIVSIWYDEEWKSIVIRKLTKQNLESSKVIAKSKVEKRQTTQHYAAADEGGQKICGLRKFEDMACF